MHLLQSRRKGNPGPWTTIARFSSKQKLVDNYSRRRLFSELDYRRIVRTSDGQDVAVSYNIYTPPKPNMLPKVRVLELRKYAQVD